MNKQNSQIWGGENSHVVHEKAIHSQQVSAWCGFWVGEAIGPYLFEDDAVTALTVNDERYCHMMTEYLCPALIGIDLD